MRELCEYDVPSDPTMAEIEQLMLNAAHNAMVLGILLAGKKDVVARAKSFYSKTYTLTYLGLGGTEQRKKAEAMVDEQVLKAHDEVDRANAEVQRVQALYDGEVRQLDVFKKLANNKLEEYRKREA